MKTSYQSPVYKIRRVPLDQIRSNAYNPNSVAPPEMKLLYQSIKEDGYTMPIVCYKLEDGTYEIVDGFHRCQIMKTYRDIYEREGGMMPVAVIDKPLGNRMASTIRRARSSGEAAMPESTHSMVMEIDPWQYISRRNRISSDAGAPVFNWIRS